MTDTATPSVARRTLAWCVIVGLVATGTTALAAADLTAEPVRGGAAVRFVPADGAAQLVRSSDGSVAVHESARGTGPAFVLGLPALVGSEQIERLGYEGVLRGQFWRETVTSAEAGTPQSSTLYLLDDAGVSMLAVTGAEAGFSFAPAAVVLPADAAPGVTWSAEGDALPQGLLHYRLAGELAAEGDGCLLASVRMDYLDPDTGEALVTVDDASTWCPGSGVVASRTDVDGTLVELAAEPLDGALPAGLGGAPVTDGALPGWAHAADWVARELSFVIADPVFGESPVGMPSDGTSAVTASGVLALGAGGDVVGYARDGTTATRSWIARPGGTVIRLAAVGDVVLAATTERRLVAYDDRGLRLWSRAFPDVVLAPVVSDGDGGVVVAALDGTVERIDLATGEPRWTAGLRTDIASRPAVAGGVVAVVDRGRVLHVLSLADGADRWEAEPLGAELVAGGGDAIAVLGVTGELTVLEASDGAQRWTAFMRGVARGVAVVDGVVVAQTDEGATGWTVEGGTRLWNDAAAEGMAIGSGQAALLGADALVVREATGDVLLRIELESGYAVTRMLAPFPDAVWVVSTSTTGTGAGP